MTDLSFEEIKQVTKALIEKIRAVNPESGAHFEKHIIFDDKNETMIFTDKPESVKLPLLANNDSLDVSMNKSRARE